MIERCNLQKSLKFDTSRGGAVVARWAHNPKVVGSSPAPATNKPARIVGLFFIMKIVYEDNHIIIVNKAPGEIVQGDKTGDTPLVDMVKAYIKETYAKPGNVFCGVVHRIDRPVGGLVIFAKTSKALSRLNEMLQKREIHKTYWAIVQGHLKNTSDHLIHYITTTEKNNKSYATTTPRKNALRSELKYNVIASGDRFSLLEIDLLTGRKHQIRVQLSAIGNPIKGDLKYGAKRSNPDGNISLLARKIEFIHPVSKKNIIVEAPIPNENIWLALSHIALTQQQ